MPARPVRASAPRRLARIAGRPSPAPSRLTSGACRRARSTASPRVDAWPTNSIVGSFESSSTSPARLRSSTAAIGRVPSALCPIGAPGTDAKRSRWRIRRRGGCRAATRRLVSAHHQRQSVTTQACSPNVSTTPPPPAQRPGAQPPSRMSWPPPASACASTTTSRRGTNHYSMCLAREARRRSPRTAADGSRSSARPAGSWRAGRRHASHSNAWSQTRLLRRVPANPEAEQVSQAHDPNQRRPRNDGKMAEPAAEHDLRRSLRVDMGPHGLRVACHPPGHG